MAYPPGVPDWLIVDLDPAAARRAGQPERGVKCNGGKAHGIAAAV